MEQLILERHRFKTQRYRRSGRPESPAWSERHEETVFWTDGKALGFLNEVVFTEKYGARASAPKVLVILTDGQDATPQLVIEEAKKLHQKDVIVFAIGVGPQNSLNMDLLGKVATEPVVEHIKSAATVEGIWAKLPQMTTAVAFVGYV